MLAGEFSIQNWKRLAATINSKKIPHYAVNDIFIGNQKAYRTCYLSLQTKRYYSEFFCSGILSCTGVGSNAWYRNAGGNPFDKNLNAFSYLVLNPQTKITTPCSSEILAGSENITLRTLRDNIIICFDSRTEIATHINDEIKVFLDNTKPIKVINC